VLKLQVYFVAWRGKGRTWDESMPGVPGTHPLDQE
jgi:hypothetical protein